MFPETYFHRYITMEGKLGMQYDKSRKSIKQMENQTNTSIYLYWQWFFNVGVINMWIRRICQKLVSNFLLLNYMCIRPCVDIRKLITLDGRCPYRSLHATLEVMITLKLFRGFLSNFQG